jgi:hypothetical protein
MQQNKARLAGEVLGALVVGDMDTAYAKAALALDDNLTQARTYLAGLSDNLAEAMRRTGGRMNEITVNGWAALDKLGSNRLADIVLGVAIDRAREINRRVEAGRDLYSTPAARPIRDNPQA